MKNYISIKGDLLPLLKIALPLIFTGLVQSGIFFFETLFFAHINEVTLAAGALVSWLFGTLAVIVFGSLSSINILVALKHGANGHSSIRFIARDGIILAILFAILTFILCWNISPVFLLFGQSEAVTKLAQAYLHALAWGLLPDLIIIAILEVIVGLGHSKIILYFTALSVFLNVLSSYILIFGKFGFPALGIAGAGWGMTISCWIVVFILIFYVCFAKNYKTYFNKIYVLKPPFFLFDLFKLGFPIGIMYCSEVAYFLALTIMMGSMGSIILAANQVVLQYLSLFVTVIFSIAQAITVRMGHLLGAKQNAQAFRANLIGIMISAIFMLCVAMIYWLFPSYLISLDFDLANSDNAQIISHIKKFLIFAGLFQIFEGIRISLFGSLRALQDTKFTLFISIFSFWGIAFIFGYIFAIHFHFGGSGFWIAMIIGAAISVLLLYWRLITKMHVKVI